MSSRVLPRAHLLLGMLLGPAIVHAQDWLANPLTSQNPEPGRMNIQDKWNNFVSETLSPLTLGAGVFNGAEAHVTNTDPKYGRDLPAFGEQVGASIGDIVSQNFFADFMLASAFHEDPRYFRRGEQWPFWSRVRYAIGHAVITRTDSGGNTFNWSNVIGNSMSASLSNAYYPPESRNPAATFSHIGVGILGTGLVDLAPEFWPDFRRKVFGRRH